MITILDGCYFVPDSEPVYWCSGDKLSRSEAVHWLQSRYGPSCTGVFINITAFGDQQDVFLLAEVEML